MFKGKRPRSFLYRLSALIVGRNTAVYVTKRVAVNGSFNAKLTVQGVGIIFVQERIFPFAPSPSKVKEKAHLSGGPSH